MGNASCEHSHAFELLPRKCLVLRALGFRDVFDHGKAVHGLAFRISNTGCGQINPNGFAALLQITLTHPVNRDFAPENPLGLVEIRSHIIRVRDFRESQSEEFRFRVPHYLTKCAIDLQEAIVLSYEREAQRTFFKYSAEALLALAQRFSPLYLFRDVLSCSHEANRDTLIVS